MKKTNLSTIILSCFFTLSAVSASATAYNHQNPNKKRFESQFQREHCTGELEVVLSDRTRVDCLTDTHAIEFDMSHKWHEAIGQSLGYAALTGKRAGIVLILRKQSDFKHWKKLNTTINEMNLPIDTWYLTRESTKLN